MTNEANALIATKLCGYDVQVSPAGKYYIVTDEGTRALLDFSVDWGESMSTFLAVAKSRGWRWRITPAWVELGLACIYYYGKMSTLQAVANALLMVAEKE